jgi:hypothetical protein
VILIGAPGGAVVALTDEMVGPEMEPIVATTWFDELDSAVIHIDTTPAPSRLAGKMALT